MTQELWTKVDYYINDLLIPPDPILDATLAASDAAGLPPHNVSPNQGKLLMLLALIHKARTILEIGTLGGYSTIWLARSLPTDGRLIILESNPKHAEVARNNIIHAGLGHLVDVRVGYAIDTLPQLAIEGYNRFDLIFIDADKSSNPQYLEWALKLSGCGSLIIADNVVRNGSVLDINSNDPNVQGIRQFNKMLSAQPRVSATAIQKL